MSTYEPLPTINKSIAIQSLLWDLDLMPEQLVRDSMDWSRMRTLVQLSARLEEAEALLAAEFMDVEWVKRRDIFNLAAINAGQEGNIK